MVSATASPTPPSGLRRLHWDQGPEEIGHKTGREEKTLVGLRRRRATQDWRPRSSEPVSTELSPATRLGLRARVAALCALLGFVVSSCLALVAVHFSDSYVNRLIDEMLRVEGDYLRERYAGGELTPR